MMFSIRFLAKTLPTAVQGPQQWTAIHSMQSTDAAVLAALPSCGEVVLLPHQENPSAPAGLGVFVVESRAFTYLSDAVQVDVMIEQTDMIPLPEAKP